jgi:hypothetical protein
VRGRGRAVATKRSVLSSASLAQPKTFELGPDALTFESPGVARASLSYAEVLALVVATHAQEEESTREQREKKLSLGRAVLSGGLVRSRTSVVTERQTTQESERVLYVLSRSGVGHAPFARPGCTTPAWGLAWAGAAWRLHDPARPAARAPQARFDDRLLKPRERSLSVSRTHLAHREHVQRPRDRPGNTS